MDEFRCDVFSADQLVRLASAPLPLGMPVSAPTRTLHRDLYLDTPDGMLRRRGVVCRLRISADDRRTLSVRMPAAPGAANGAAPRRVDRAVLSAEPAAALAERTAVSRLLRSIVDPALLEARVALEVERYMRTALPDWLRRPRLELHYDQITVRSNGSARVFQQLCVHRVRRGGAGAGGEVEQLAHAFQQEHGLRVLAVSRRERAELLLKWMQTADVGAAAIESDTWPQIADGEPGTADAEELNPELSLLAFQERVLTLAEDEATPLAERLRFLGIVSANVDEFFTVRFAGLKASATARPDERGDDGLTQPQQLEAVTQRIAALAARQDRGFRACAHELALRGVRIRRWPELRASQHAELRARFRDEIYPALTPLAMTLSPGHPFPRLAHLSLSIAVVLLDRDGGAPHFTEVELPEEVPRLLRLDQGDGSEAYDVIPVEEVVRANLDALYPACRVDQAYLFRVTRGGDLQLDEGQSGDLLEAMAAATSLRPHNAVVRVEVERDMPPVLRDLVLDGLRRERDSDVPALSPHDVYEIDGPLDLRCLASLDLADRPELAYEPFRPRRPVRGGESLLDAIRARDLLVHHPFDSFAKTIVRFLREAAVDPDVAAIKITLYRVGDRSPVIGALRRAARRGKRVVAFVELKARFDEERNVGWVRALERAGVHVVYGLVGLKTHAKVALVVRREQGKLRRYVHVGTGNYNTRAGLGYTDLSLFSGNEALAADVSDLFNALTGSSTPPERLAHGALLAPHQLLPAMLDQIEQEAAHARAGRDARIRIKVNGLSDGAVVRALYRAAQDGVTVELVVRGVCTLRPGVPGRSERIRVVAVAGRFLEHSRIYHFANGGDARYFIGSADLRPRNLRRRVELLVPVHDPACQAQLDRLLDLYLADPSAWELAASGAYVRRTGEGVAAQDALLAEVRALASPAG